MRTRVAAQAKTRASTLNRDARTVVGAAVRRRRGPFATQLRQVGPKLHIPALPPAAGVWAIAMVKNEADIIETTVRHLASQGVDHFLVMDNGSSDATPQILHDLAATLPGFHHGRDAEPAHYQGAKMTHLADAARRAGATWVLPFDADEFWYGVGSTVSETLANADASIVEAHLHNVFPSTDGHWQVDSSPQPLTKVAFRPSRTMTVGEGNHAVARPGAWQSGLRILHMPLRSYEQFRRKVLGGAEALALTDLPESTGRHWRDAGRQDEDQLRELWNQALTGHVPLMGLAPSGHLVDLGTTGPGSSWPSSLDGHAQGPSARNGNLQA